HLFFHCHPPSPSPPSFPTRRSSDLINTIIVATAVAVLSVLLSAFAAYAFSRFRFRGRRMGMLALLLIQMFPQQGKHAHAASAERSEEHTSELQSRFDLVCRLLLEKK